MDGKSYKPYIPAEKSMPEITVASVVIGILLAVVFGGANAYLGLRVGMTVSASIPAAVVSMGIIRKLLKKESILENNMVQTIGSAGEALAGGAIFTLPVLFMWATEGMTSFPSVVEICLITMVGGILGVAFMVPLRNALIVEEHGTLPFPEGMACAKVLIAGEEGGAKSATVFKGLGISAAYKFIADGLHIFPSEVNWDIAAFKGSAFGADILPALAGVGFICGVRVSAFLFAGGFLAWFVLLPLIALFGGETVIAPASVTVNELLAAGGPIVLWSNYIRYIGAGAVLGAGILSMVKTLPLIVRTFKASVGDLGGGSESGVRTQQNIPMPVLAGIVAACVLFIWLVPAIPVNLVGAVIIVVFGFIFAAVTSRIVGLVGCNNNPGSGMTIATLIITCLIFRLTGNVGIAGMVSAIAIACVICTIVAVSGDTSQDLKTGFLVGATPKKQQIGEIIGIVAASLAIGAILMLLHRAWGYGSSELPAPQAMLMRMVVEGVMGGNLPWNMILIGVCISVMAEILGLQVLPFAVGMYLPIHLSAGMMCGGLVRLVVERRKTRSEAEKEETVERGVLYTSGLIAGEGVLGILLALLAVFGINLNLGFSIGQIGGIVCFAALLISIYRFAVSDKKS